MITSWNRQRRRVRHLYGQLAVKQRNEADRRGALVSWMEHTFLRFETVIWVGVTGAFWIARRRNPGETKHSGLLGDLLVSIWKMQRWRRLTHRVTSRLFLTVSNNRPVAETRLAATAADQWSVTGD